MLERPREEQTAEKIFPTLWRRLQARRWNGHEFTPSTAVCSRVSCSFKSNIADTTRSLNNKSQDLQYQAGKQCFPRMKNAPSNSAANEERTGCQTNTGPPLGLFRSKITHHGIWQNCYITKSKPHQKNTTNAAQAASNRHDRWRLRNSYSSTRFLTLESYSSASQ